MTRPLVLIPARTHSTGVPNKMLRSLGGKPVLHWAIETGQKIGSVVVATPDEEIASALPVNVKRLHEPEILDGQPVGARSLDAVVRWATDCLRGDELIVLQATSPFTRAATVTACLDMVRSGAMSARTVVDDRHLRWEGPRLVTRRVPRQALPPAWREHGACTVVRWSHAKQFGRYDTASVLVPVDGAEAVDIDTEADWVLAQYYCAKVQHTQLAEQVLRDTPSLATTVIQLSAYDEPDSERLARQQVVERLHPSRVIRPYASHTYQEAIDALATIDGGDVVLVTSAYHQPRAFLTFLQVLQETGRASRVTLWNAPARTDFDPGDEAEKIAQYQVKGHVAQYHEGLTYLAQRSRSAVAV